jgi:hypothetical protein
MLIKILKIVNSAADSWIKFVLWLYKSVILSYGYIYVIFQIYKSIKKSQNSRNQCFAYYFCLIIDGSGSLLNGSRSERPKTIWILRIQIPIRIGIRNTA